MAYALPYALSPEQQTNYERVLQAALLPSLVIPGENELAVTYKEAQRVVQKHMMEPYADLLEEHILSIVATEKERILDELRTSPHVWMSAKIFSWNTIHYHETLKDMLKRQSAMTYDETIDHYQWTSDRAKLIKDKGLEHEFGVFYSEGVFTYWPLPCVKIERIFKNTNLADRIALSLGPNFTAFIRAEFLEENTRDFKMDAMKHTLCVRFHPFGPQRSTMVRLLSVVESEAERKSRNQKRTLNEGEMKIFTK
jgi:hypothetical protein